MESNRSQEFKVGLLMIAGALAITLIVLWSDSMLFANYYRVTAFLDNAGGLRSGSPVTLAGLRIGQIVSVAPNDDSRGAIRAELSINEDYTLYESSDLTLRTSGVFGDSFLEFSRPEDDPGAPLDTDGTAWVRVEQGMFDIMLEQSGGIVSAVGELLSEQNRDNFSAILERGARVMAHAERMTDQGDELLREARQAVREAQQLTAALQTTQEVIGLSISQTAGSVQDSLAAAQEQLNRISSRLEVTLRTGNDMLHSVQASSDAVTDLVTRNREGITELSQRLGGLAAQAQAILASLEQGEGVLGQLLVNDALAADLNETVITARELSERLADHPEVLIWGQTEEEAAAARKRRDAMRARRAFHEGYRRYSEPVQEPAVTEVEP